MATRHHDRATPAGPTTPVVVIIVLLALIATGCRVSEDVVARAERPAQPAEVLPSDSGETIEGAEPRDQDARETPTVEVPVDPPSDLPRELTVAQVTCVAPGQPGAKTGLTPAGEELFASYLDEGAAVPAYQLVVDVNPATGQVAGAMRASIPSQERTLNFRVFAGMDAFESGLEIRNVSVNGVDVDAELDRALLSVPGGLSSDQLTIVELDFSYAIDQMAANENLFGALSGDTLQPDQVGLLGRTETGMQLGHWFPVWLPEGIRTDPDPSGFGDIGAFPAANICASITVPPSYQTVTSGVLSETTETSIIEVGAGLRDFAILISNDLALATGVVDRAQIRVWGPSDDPDALLTVLDYAERSQQALTRAFGPYPWREIDIVAAPLGGGVGGMEWPGMIWIERSMFGGGLPGLGQFGELFRDSDLDSLLGSFGGEALTTSLEWTVAHELGHEWWHALVGNDSIASPAVDEPLAQFSACVAMIELHPDRWRAICEAQTIEQYAQARSLGIDDVAAEQPSDGFDSSIQYGAIVYGKAPGFYLAAADLIGWNELGLALKAFVADNAFALVSTDALRTHLVEAAGDDGPAIEDLWDRWFRSAKGDEDIEPSDLFLGLGGLEGFEGLEDLDLENLDIEDLLEGLDIEGLDFEELFEGLLEEEGVN